MQRMPGLGELPGGRTVSACRETDACLCRECYLRKFGAAALEKLELAELADAAAAGIVVVGCGAAKLPHRAPAQLLYTGSYSRACMLTARVLAPGRWWILSAAHGLIPPGRPTEPYDMTLGEPGAITGAALFVQASDLGLLGEPVIALCGTRYADLLEYVWPKVRRPLAGLGIGRQRHVLAVLRGNGRRDHA